MATINGTFNSLIAGTLSGTVATPGATGPAGPTGPTGPTGAQGIPGVGVPAGGSTGQFLTKSSNLDYSTGWSTLSLAGYATESWVTAGFYPLVGNPSGFLTSASLAPYLTKADNLGSLTNFATARSNLSLGTLNTPVFAGVTAQGSGSNVANLTPSALSITHSTFGNFTIQPSSGITFPDSTVQSTAFTTAQLSAYLAKASNLSDLPSASSARTNLGLGSLAVVNDAPSDGSQYARKNAAWNVIIPGDRYLTSSTTSLTIDNNNKTLTVSTGLSYTPQQDVVIAYDASNHMHARVLTYNSGTGVMTVDVQSHTGTGTFSFWTVNVGGTVPLQSVAWGGITGTLSSQLDLDSALSGKLSLLGGTIADAGLVNFLSSSTDSTVVIGAGEVKNSSNTLSTNFSSVLYDSVTVQDASGSTIHTATGIVFADATFQSTAYAPADVLQKSNNLSEITATASTARTNLGLGSLATVNDAPADGSQYARKNNAWEVVSGGGGGDAFNWADLFSTRIYVTSFSLTGSDPESPYETDQYINFDFCCPEAVNQLKSNNSDFNLFVSLYQGSSLIYNWNIASSTISATSNSRSFYSSIAYGNSFDALVVVTLGGGLTQVSKFKLGNVGV